MYFISPPPPSLTQILALCEQKPRTRRWIDGKWRGRCKTALINSGDLLHSTPGVDEKVDSFWRKTPRNGRESPQQRAQRTLVLCVAKWDYPLCLWVFTTLTNNFAARTNFTWLPRNIITPYDRLHSVDHFMTSPIIVVGKNRQRCCKQRNRRSIDNTNAHRENSYFVAVIDFATTCTSRCEASNLATQACERQAVRMIFAASGMPRTLGFGKFTSCCEIEDRSGRGRALFGSRQLDSLHAVGGFQKKKTKKKNRLSTERVRFPFSLSTERAPTHARRTYRTWGRRHSSYGSAH